MSEQVIFKPSILDLGDRHYWTPSQLDLILQKFTQDFNPDVVKNAVFWNTKGYLQLVFRFLDTVEALHEAFDKYTVFGQLDTNQAVRDNGMVVLDDRTTIGVINTLLPCLLDTPDVTYTESEVLDAGVVFHAGHDDGTSTPDLHCYKVNATIVSIVKPKDGSIAMETTETKNGFVMAASLDQAGRKARKHLEVNSDTVTAHVVSTLTHVAQADDSDFHMDFFIP